MNTLPPNHPPAAEVLAFWREAGPKKWFKKDEAFDTQFRERFLALQAARRALDAGFDQQVDEELRNFFYLPLMHSESLSDQQQAVALTRPLGADAHRFAILHRDIIGRFGRFPHRNAVLGRATTPEEQAFLDEGGFAG